MRRHQAVLPGTVPAGSILQEFAPAVRARAPQVQNPDACAGMLGYTREAARGEGTRYFAGMGNRIGGPRRLVAVGTPAASGRLQRHRDAMGKDPAVLHRVRNNGMQPGGSIDACR